MQNVFHNADDIAVIGSDWIDRLKGIALTSPLKRARICLHRSDEDCVHEMIIALARDCLFPPHRHVAKNESFHMIEGRLGVVIFNDDGSTRRSFVLAPPGQQGSICLSPRRLGFSRGPSFGRCRCLSRDNERPVCAWRSDHRAVGSRRSCSA